jgi:hypothetical protein
MYVVSLLIAKLTADAGNKKIFFLCNEYMPKNK